MARVKEILKGIFAEMRKRDKDVEGRRKSLIRYHLIESYVLKITLSGRTVIDK